MQTDTTDQDRTEVARSLKRWEMAEAPDPAVVQDLMDKTKVLPETICRLLVQRGVTTVEAARTFMKPQYSHLHDPFLMKDLRPLAERLARAREQSEKVGILGDYDCDGVSSAALLTNVLRDLGIEVYAFVQHRMIDGYGVSERALRKFHEAGVSLVVTCDTGSSAADEIRFGIEELGLEIYVTDHHLMPVDENEVEVPPPATGLVNPNQAACSYPFKGLCGVGVAYKVLQGLVQVLGLSEDDILHPYLDLVALGTVADVVPLRDENRVFVRRGVWKVRQSRVLGLRALLDVAGVPPADVTETTFAWVVGPRINAVGRIDDAGKALELLITDDLERARSLAKEIDELNRKRQEMTRAIEERALEMVKDLPLDDLYGVALFDDGKGDEPWHHGVIGIVAGRLVERLGRPVFVFAKDEGSNKWKGSGRAPDVGRVHLKDALDQIREHLQRYGGHRAAAGATLKAKTRKEMAAFAAAFNEASRSMMDPEDRIPTLSVDLDVRLGDLDHDLYHTLTKWLAPFGEGNEMVKLMARGVQIRDARRIGADKTHLKMTAHQDGQSIDVVAWGMADAVSQLVDFSKPFEADLCFRLDQNEWRGRISLQLVLDDIRPTGSAQASLDGGLFAQTSTPPGSRTRGHAPGSLFA